MVTPRTVRIRLRIVGALLCSMAGGLALGLPGCGTGRSDRSLAPETERRADALRDEARVMFAEARERVFPALVHIHVVTVNYWGGKEEKGASVGSGTLISRDGHIVTNQHVTSNGRRFRVTLTDRRELDARLIGEDPLTDLAVLQVDPAEFGPDAPVADFGDSDVLEVGDYVMAMGSPFSLSRSVTLGIVSNTERVFGGEFGGDEVEELEFESGQRTGLFTNWIQHDAAINPGNSGGPLVNLRGEVIGVNALGGSNMGFAIPSNLAQRVVADLIAHGAVPRSEIGVSFKALQRAGRERGVLLNSVVAGGPADRAGLQAGDILVAVEGEELAVRFLEQVPPLMKRIAQVPVGTELRVRYEREGEAHETTIVTQPMQRDRGDEAAFRAWGLTAMEITPKMARDRRLDGTAGVLVSSIRSGGPAATAEPPLPWSGAVIRALDGQPVQDLEQFTTRYREIMQQEPLPEFVLVEFDHQGRNHVTLLKPKPEDDPDLPREVPKAWIGIATQPLLRDLAAQLGHPEQTGFRITRVYPGTVAAGSELQVGDVIVGLNGTPFRLRGLEDGALLSRELRRMEIGDAATLQVLRDRSVLDVSVKLEPTRLPREEARRDRNRDFELTVREVTFFDRDENRWTEEIEGVIVEQVEAAGWAGLAGIQTGDLILRIDGKPVRGLPTYRKIMAEVTANEPVRVVFVVLRGVRTHFHFVEPEWLPTVTESETSKETD
ncbi:MAG: PDZ domain-containing protein [Phycisphaerales bacterium]|nr:PDZ domain-containing protein [Phycisphaerales bacterium]